MKAAVEAGLWAEFLPGADSALLVGEFCQQWLDDQYCRSVSPDQARNARGLIRNHLGSKVSRRDMVSGVRSSVPFEQMPLGEVRRRTVAELFTAREKAGVRDSVRRHLYDVLAKAWDWAVVMEDVETNVVRAVPRPVVRDAQERQPWTRDQMRRFLTHPAVVASRFHAAYHIGAYPGLRQGEILALTWGDIDEDGLRVRVAHQLKRRDDGYARVNHLKGENDHGWRAIHPEAAAALRRHRERMTAEWANAGIVMGDAHLVFVTEDGAPKNGNVFRTEFLKLAASVGDLPRIVFHATRYFAETLDASAGINDVVAMRQRGRKSPASRRHYTAPLLDDQVRAAERTRDLLWEQGPVSARVGAHGSANQPETA